MKKAFKLPDIGEGITEAEVISYLVKQGEHVEIDQPVVKIETDKAVVDLPCPFSGIISEIPHRDGEMIHVDETILFVDTNEIEPIPAMKERAAASQIVPIKEKDQIQQTTVEDRRQLITPHTRRLARDLGVDIRFLQGSGPRGRIIDDDVHKGVRKIVAAPPKAPTAAAAPSPSTTGFDFEKYGPIKREPLKGIRKRIAEVMTRSVSAIPHVAHFDEADVSELMKVLSQEKVLTEKRGIKLTPLAFVFKAVSDALREYPILNSSLDENTGDMIFKGYIHIGFATNTKDGLMVPVIRDVDKKPILQIAAEISALAEKARERKIDLNEMRGGSFTITNIGAIGGKWATPIILHPQVAILCTMRVEDRPVVRDGEIVIRKMMPLTLSFDHRALDGADAARFTSHIIGLLQDPYKMLLEVI